VKLSRLHFPVTTLGPGRRVGIWFQGCSIRCPGCISIDTWATNTPKIAVAQVLDLVLSWPADGVTVSGGEPFDQPEALFEFLSGLREHRPDCDVLAYSGYPVERLETSPCLALIDALISDPFQAEQSQSLALRGSDNQRLHFLSERGRQRFQTFERLRNTSDDTLDLVSDADGTIWLAGIPQRGALESLKNLLQTQGTVIATTEGKL